MRNMDTIRALVGEGLREKDLDCIDAYATPRLGLFIPSCGPCGYAAEPGHSHPAYMAVIHFPEKADGERADFFPAYLMSPGVAHNDDASSHYYCVMIEKDFFEEQYRLYDVQVPFFAPEKFTICRDILRALNMFAAEYGKGMANCEVTLAAQALVITHWLIRSVRGETAGMRAIPGDFSLARAQQYMEAHFDEKIAVADLARLGYMSPASLNRRFRTETGKSPIEYLIAVRVDRAKAMLRRRERTVSEIAVRCGFSGATHFARAFLAATGMSPTEYRAKYVD